MSSDGSIPAEKCDDIVVKTSQRISFLEAIRDKIEWEGMGSQEETLLRNILDAYEYSLLDDFDAHDLNSDREPPSRLTLTLSDSHVFDLLKEEDFQLVLRKKVVEEILERHLKIIDDSIKNRINGPYTPELNLTYFKRINDTVKTEVDNYIRIHYHEIKQMIDKAIDKQVESHIDFEVNRRLKEVMKRMQKTMESETPPV